MKVTKRQLRRIIKEEMTRLGEYGYGNRPPVARHEMEDMANAIEIATDFIRDAAGTDENDFDSLVQYLAHHSWYDENQAADMIDQLIDDGEIQYDSRNDEFYM